MAKHLNPSLKGIDLFEFVDIDNLRMEITCTDGTELSIPATATRPGPSILLIESDKLPMSVATEQIRLIDKNGRWLVLFNQHIGVARGESLSVKFGGEDG